MALHKQLLIYILFFLGLKTCAQDRVVRNADLQPILGCWEGTLTYLDYRSGKPFTMPANLVISEGSKGTYLLHNMYPNEPKANATDTLRLDNGTVINGEKIVSTYRNEQNDLVVVTEGKGIDGNDNQEATFRHTYIIGKSRFLHKKEVHFLGGHEWIRRNEFSYTAVACK